ncbi:hypothetical protein [Methylobacterium oryzae]|uniref:hypothetical protein n=1 Tax=Methylobacterium oryzae TaxID=334852 RepID=UPI002F35D21E
MTKTYTEQEQKIIDESYAFIAKSMGEKKPLIAIVDHGTGYKNDDGSLAIHAGLAIAGIGCKEIAAGILEVFDRFPHVKHIVIDNMMQRMIEEMGLEKGKLKDPMAQPAKGNA